MRVTLANCQTEVQISAAQFKRIALQAVDLLNIRGSGRIEISLVSAPQIKRLNKQLLGHDWVTDVISMRYDDALKRKQRSRVSRPGPLGEAAAVGEIWISPKAASRYAAENGLDVREEIARYIVHGLLHWIGFDDRTMAQQKQMRAREWSILKKIGFSGESKWR